MFVVVLSASVNYIFLESTANANDYNTCQASRTFKQAVVLEDDFNRNNKQLHYRVVIK